MIMNNIHNVKSVEYCKIEKLGDKETYTKSIKIQLESGEYVLITLFSDIPDKLKG